MRETNWFAKSSTLQDWLKGIPKSMQTWQETRLPTDIAKFHARAAYKLIGHAFTTRSSRASVTPSSS